MSVMTIRGIDEETSRALKEKAKKEGLSLNAIVLKTIRASLGFEKPKRRESYGDLEYLAGTWCEEDSTEFNKNIAETEKVDKEMWK